MASKAESLEPLVEYAKGTMIWIRDDELVWKSAEILGKTGEDLLIKTEDELERKVPRSDKVYLKNKDEYTSAGLVVWDDLTQLTHLHEPAVLHALNLRFDVDNIYTFTGPILIALNPFKRIPGLYDTATLKSFITPKPSSTPHVFATSNAAFRGICDRQRNQTVLISGESGAGKTETTKFVMKFLAMAGAADGKMTNVERQVLESNPLLEAFGNARTLRNDNSSRFGKFIELQFQTAQSQPHGGTHHSLRSESGVPAEAARLCGARLHTYLLEKVRITDQQEGERNFHIFYQACAAASAYPTRNSQYPFPQYLPRDRVPQKVIGDVDLTGFGEHSEFAYLCRSSVCELDKPDIEEFERTIYALRTIGVSNGEINAMMNVVAAVLNLGNITFEDDDAEQSSVMTGRDRMEMVSQLLGLRPEALELALTHRLIKTLDGVIQKGLNRVQASDTRDSLARQLYGLLFLRVVKRTNESIGYKAGVNLFCGVLDIFGFECFRVNSFEQLCINFTNERLQQFFNTFVFKLEEELYKREGIPWDPLDFPDNQDAVDLLALPTEGVFAMLDEECRIPGGKDQSYCNKLVKKHGGHKRFGILRTKPDWFVINHFAGPVQYHAEGFLDKNKDQLSQLVFDTMTMSQKPYVASLFAEQNSRFSAAEYAQSPSNSSGPRKKKAQYSVSSEFRDQLQSLMSSVNGTEPHFIRCIKPNPQNLPDVYDRPSVTEQLRYGGVLQAVQVSRAGYPVRIKHLDCWHDYRHLLAEKERPKSGDVKTKCEFLMSSLAVKLKVPVTRTGGISWAVGGSLVFFKQEAFEIFQGARISLRNEKAVTIQAKYKGMLERRRYLMMGAAATKIQALLRGRRARNLCRHMRERAAAVKIQSFLRSQRAQKQLKKAQKMAARIQAVHRGRMARAYFAQLRQHRAASKIQAHWRGRDERLTYLRLVEGTKLAQQCWRMKAAKTQLRKLKMEQKEVGSLLAKFQKLQVEHNKLKKHSAEQENSALSLQTELKHIKTKLEKVESEKHSLEAAMKSLKAAQEAELAGCRQLHEEELEKARQEAVHSVNQEAKAHIPPPSSLHGSPKVRMEQEKEMLQGKVEELSEQLGALQILLKEKDDKLMKAQSRYDLLLSSQALSSQTGLSSRGGSSHFASKHDAQQSMAAASGHRSLDMVIVGPRNVGKTKMLHCFVKQMDPAANLNHDPHDTSHMHSVQIHERHLKIQEVCGRPQLKPLVENVAKHAANVVVVFDPCSRESFQSAIEYLRLVSRLCRWVVLLANTHNIIHGAMESQVDTEEITNAANAMGALSMESCDLTPLINNYIRMRAENQGPAKSTSSLGVKETAEKPPVAASPARSGGIISGMANFFGSAGRALQQVAGGSHGNSRSEANGGLLRASLKGLKGMKTSDMKENPTLGLRPVQEVQDAENAVTCIAFGHQRYKKYYILLAAASKEGSVVIYKCLRTEMEISMLSREVADPLDERKPQGSPKEIDVHVRLNGHQRAVTSLFFNLLEDHLVSTSIDKSVRIWNVDTGEMVKVFTDASSITVASFLPFNPSVFVAGNANAILRLVNMSSGSVMQKLKVESEVRALKFDDTGLFLIAGTKAGSLHVLEASDNVSLKFKFKLSMARGGITCISFVPAQREQPPFLIVNSSDSCISLCECHYGPQPGVLSNLVVRHRLKVAHSLLPLKSAYSRSGEGFIVTGSEDKGVYVFSLAKGANYKMNFLTHHSVPVVAVAINEQDTLMASADSLGKVVLWRRLEYSSMEHREGRQSSQTGTFQPPRR